MSSDSLHERGKVLEDLFFAGREQQLLAALKAKKEQEHSIEEIASHTGIADQGVLERVTAMGVSVDSLAAFNIVPLLAVAWGDNVMDAAEREAILLEAIADGMKSSDNSYKLLESWLTRAPNAELVSAWKDFYGQLQGLLSADERASLKASILERARRIARTSGGFLGMGAVSEGERNAIEELESILG
jgi:hypothetical protein